MMRDGASALLCGEADGIRVELRDALCQVTLDNPAHLNAMRRASWERLRCVFEQIQQSPAIRCVLLCGAQGNFCAGGDIAQYPDFRFDPAALAQFHEHAVWGGLAAMLACDVPLVAAIEGVCMGAGLEIASCCDVRLGAAGARFGAPIARLGFPMAPREAALVMGAVGATAARAMLLAAEIYSAEDLRAQGFLTQLVPDGQAVAAAERLAQRIVTLAPQAARLNKQTLRRLQAGEPVDGAYDFAAHPEHREGIFAFLEKRKPNF